MYHTNRADKYLIDISDSAPSIGNSYRMEHNSKRFCSLFILIMLITTSLLLTSIVTLLNCDDNLRQTNDQNSYTQIEANDIGQSSDTQTKQQQLADPDNLKRELKDLLSRKIDSDKDGSVSYEELKSYLAALHEKNIDYNVEKQWVVYSPQIHEVFSWEGYEPERQEVLTWDHYFNQTYPELIGVDVGIPMTREQDTSQILNPTERPEEPKTTVASNDDSDEPHMKMLKLMVRRADARWKLADENGDTLLTKPEFRMLLHPDEGHEELQKLFVREATEDMDLNKDGKICLEEFMKHLQILASEQERNDQSWLSSQQENFGRFLDKNKDGVLDGDEIKDWLVPSKQKKFELEAKRLFDIGDTNEDHKLSSTEILEQYEQYITLIPAEYWQTSEDLIQEGANQHDEL